LKRAEAEARVKALGGSTKSSVTKGLSYLVTNDPASGSEKNRKAVSYGVAVIGEEDFLALVANASGHAAPAEDKG
jgi:DNA ligase (NAD+)